MHFWPKKHFSAEYKNSSFFDGPDGSTKFRWKRSKIKGTYTYELTQAENGQKLGLALKNDQYLGNPIFLGVIFNGKVVPRGIWWYALLTKIEITIQKILAAKIQIFGSKMHIFVPSGQFEPHRAKFSARKRCLIGPLIWGYQKFYSIPPKNGFYLSKTPMMTWQAIWSKLASWT